MIKEGLVFKNTKGNPCVILKVDDKYCWVFAKTRRGFNCNHYGKWYIEECLVKENYRVLANYETWQKAITIYFADKTEELSQISNMELRDQLEAKEQMIKTREKVIDEQQHIIQDLTHKFIRAKWWLKEIVENHRFTPISTAEMALKELTESKNDTKNILC